MFIQHGTNDNWIFTDFWVRIEDYKSLGFEHAKTVRIMHSENKKRSTTSL